MSSFAQFVNGSFEDPPLNNPGDFTGNGLVNGWFTTNAGVWRLPSSTFFNVSAPHGLQIGYLSGAWMAQQITDTIQVGANVLTFDAGKRDEAFSGSFRVDLFSGGSVNAGGVTGGTLLGSYDFDRALFAPQTFTPAQILYTASTGDPNVGKRVSVMISKTSGHQANFDNFRFVGAPVPEPATLAVLAVGLPFLAKRRKH